MSFSLLLLAACSSGSSGDESNGKPKFDAVVVVSQNQGLQPLIVNSELIVGENRFTLALIDSSKGLTIGPKVHLSFYNLTNGQETLESESDATLRIPALDAGVPEQVIHMHADGTRHIHINAGPDAGVYTAMVNFDSAGEWGVEIGLDTDDKPGIDQTLLARFTVTQTGTIPAPGQPAPASENLTAADVTDLSTIDSAAEPDASLHQETIADAVAAGKPTVVLFASPGYDTSTYSGPEYAILQKLQAQYGDRAQFIEVEFFEHPGDPSEDLSGAASQWNLPTEPWFFVIDADGVISARFEGPTTLQELRDALAPLLAS